MSVTCQAIITQAIPKIVPVDKIDALLNMLTSRKYDIDSQKLKTSILELPNLSLPYRQNVTKK